MAIAPVYIVHDVARHFVTTWTFEFVYFMQAADFWLRTLPRSTINSSMALLLPALLVFAWLPLFAFSAIGLRAAGRPLKYDKRAPWFIKAGKQHPLRAIAIVASASVFIGITVGRLFKN